MSDLFRDEYGHVGLRYALIIALLPLLPSALAYWRVGRHFKRDMEG